MIDAGVLPEIRSNSEARGRLVRALAGAVVIVGVVVNAVVGILSLLAPTAFLAAIGEGGSVLTPSSLVFAGYSGARELGIGVALALCAALRIPPALAGALMVAAAANAVDAIDAVTTGRWAQLPGAFLFAAAYACAAMWYARQTARSTHSVSRLA